MPTIQEEIVFEFLKSQTLKIIGKIVSSNVKRCLDVRIYYINEYSGEWLPTPKGFRIPLNQIEDLKMGIDKAHQIWWESLPGASDK